MAQQQQQAIHKFVLGSKELEGKTAEFGYDKGWYSITDIVGEERQLIYRSRNAQEAYMKWNVYIGRKKERPVEEHRKTEYNENERSGERNRDRNRQNRNNRDNRDSRGSAAGKRDGQTEGRVENRNNRNRDWNRDRNRQNRDDSHKERGNREENGNREARRDRRRNRSDRSRRDRESAGQE